MGDVNLYGNFSTTYMEGSTLPVRHTDWLLILLLITAFLFVLARQANRARFAVFQKLPFHIKGKEVAQNYNPLLLSQGHDFLATTGAAIALVSVIFWLNQNSPGQEAPALLFEPLRFLQIGVMVIAFLLVKSLFSALVGTVFDGQEYIIAAQNRSFAFLSWLSFPVIPILFVVLYVPYLSTAAFYSLYTLLIAGYIYATFQSFLLIWQMPGTVVYKVLYLCTLEIIPVLFLIKWFNSL